MDCAFIQMLLAFLSRTMRCVIVCSLFFVLVTAQKHVIDISWKNGTNNESCLTSNGSIPCRTLDFTLRHFHENATNSTLVKIEPGRYEYSLNLTFFWLKDFTVQVKSPGRRKAVINCTQGAGFSFQNSAFIHFRGIRFQGCGASHMSTTGEAYGNYSHANFSAAIFLVDCEDLSIDNCDIVDSPGIGVNLYDIGGTVSISRTLFERNGPLSCPSTNCTVCTTPGGGVYIELTRYGGVYPWDRKGHSVNNSFYLFDSCNFTHNRSPPMVFEDQITEHGFFKKNRHNSFGRGGAVSLYLFGLATGNVFKFKNCNFLNNKALYGAGLFVEFHDFSENNSVTINGCSFENNTADLAGGAVRSGSVTKEEKNRLKENKIIQQQCNYTANTAIFGGAVSHFGRKYLPLNESDPKLHEVLFSNCHWIENKATVGSAIGLNLDPMSEKTTRPVSPFHVLLENCTVSKNAIVLSEDDVVIGQGSLFTHSVPVIFKGTVLFEDNTNMSALVLDNTVLKVHDICIFRNNSGQSGGAIALYGESQIMTMKNSTLVFANNTASVKGGAIYVQTPGPPLAAFETRKLAIYQCFLAHENLSIEDVEYWLTNISFINNLASGWGNSVYATTLQSCFKRNDTRLNNSALLWPVVHFLPKDFQQHIGTAPVFINVTTSDWFVAPSQWFNTSVHLRNERNEPCNGTIQIDVKSGQSTSDDVELNEPSPLFLIPQNGTIPNIRLKGKPKSNFTVSFKTLQGQLIQHTIDSTLKPCWPGYKQSDDKKACECLDKDKYPGMLRCGDNNKDVYLKSGFWFGNVSEQNIKVYSTFSCPEHYCRNHTNRTGFFEGFLYEEKRMCSENRTGILCGQCKNGTNLLLGSDDCRVEKKHDKLYAALVLLGFAVGAVFLILFLLLFDLGIFIKYFSCWLFSYQVMEFLKYEGDDLDPVITAVIEIPNWRIPGIGMCIIPGMNDLQKLGFNYLLPLYILGVLLVLGIISEKRPQCYYNRNGARILPGCCVLLILCYTNVISISFKIFHWVHLPTEFNSTWVLFVDGNISPEYCKHDFWCISLSVIAALGFIFLIPIPIVLSLRPPVIRNYRTIRHLCSIFQECFQEGKEWFASVYFFLRIVVIIIAMFMPAGAYTPLKRITLDILTVIILVTFVHLKPYNERYSELNKLDAFLLGHLCLFTLLCSNRGNESTKYMQEILWYFIDVLAYVPLLYLICILSYLSYIKRAILANHWVTFRQKLFDIFCQCRDVERNLENLLDQEATTTETSEDD